MRNICIRQNYMLHIIINVKFFGRLYQDFQKKVQENISLEWVEYFWTHVVFHRFSCNGFAMSGKSCLSWIQYVTWMDGYNQNHSVSGMNLDKICCCHVPKFCLLQASTVLIKNSLPFFQDNSGINSKINVVILNTYFPHLIHSNYSMGKKSAYCFLIYRDYSIWEKTVKDKLALMKEFLPDPSFFSLKHFSSF